MKQVTIILPVYNGMHFVRPCLDALVEHTASEDYFLVLMDDFSDDYTAEFLHDAAQRFDDCMLMRNEENLGFLRTCNHAWSHCDTPFVLLLNSDVLVTPDWLPRMLHCAEQDPKIASVNPLTNHAADIDLPVPQGCNHLGLDRQLAARIPHCHDVVTGGGFCLLLRRQAVGEQLFDEVYGMGSCEESDLCMRLTSSGWRTVFAEHVYVYHRRHGSFSDRDERYLKNRRIFDDRWVDEYRRQFSEFRRKDPLGSVRETFAHKRQFWPIRHARETIRSARRQVSVGGIKGALREVTQTLQNPSASCYPIISKPLVRRCSRQEAPSVTYIFHRFGFTGGVLSVIQLVNELILRGIDARIATVNTYPGFRDWTWLLTEPMVFKSPKHLIKSLPPTDIAIATEWCTAPWVHTIGKEKIAQVTAYFLQDYEPWFIPEEDQETREHIIADYNLIPNRIVKSDWLACKLAKHGYETKKIRLGMDLDQFYPRERTPGPPTVLAMGRPNTPWRGFSTATAALAEVKRQMPETRVVFFGSDDLNHIDIPYEYESTGKVTNRDRLAQLYSGADVFLETSTFQGFGRCALEAMACGTAVVLTPKGGVVEYARPDENCLAIAPDAPLDAAAAVLRLLRNVRLKDRFTVAGILTARRFCHRREAVETAAYFRQILSQ